MNNFPRHDCISGTILGCVQPKSVPRDSFAARLRARRKAVKLSQKQAAAKLGVAEGTYAHWEQGIRLSLRSDKLKERAILDALR